MESADSPQIVTLDESPPNLVMSSATYWSLRRWSRFTDVGRAILQDLFACKGTELSNTITEGDVDGVLAPSNGC